MSFKETKELRKAGKLDEALQKANQDLQAEPDNIWNKRSIAWVYYEFLKKYAHPESFDSFKENLIKIKELQLPEDEKMVFDNCAWQIGSMMFALQKSESVDYGKINSIFEIIKGFHFTKPSEAYSFVYKAFHKSYQYWSRYLEFADWWGFDNFRPEDYLKEEYEGRKIMAIVEQAYIAYSKKLLEGEPLDGFIQVKEIHKEKIHSFLPLIDKIIENHPEYQYPPYFKAKLLLALGDEENVLTAFIPFARQKRNDFWVWEIMAEIYSDNSELQFSCYCKALSLKTPEDFLVKIRETFAEILIDRKLFKEAKTEIERIFETRTKHEWKISNKMKNWMAQEWFATTESKKNNYSFYLEKSSIADELLFADIKEEIVVVEFVNKNKGMLNFVKDTEKQGFFKYAGVIKDPQIGDILKVRFNGDGQNSFYKVFTAKKADDKTQSDAIKNFDAKIHINLSQSFGFVDDVFVEPGIIQKYNLKNGDKVNGSAILSFNKKKGEWGWKAFKIAKEFA